MHTLGQWWVSGKPVSGFWSARLGEEASLGGYRESRSRLEGGSHLQAAGNEMVFACCGV